MSMSVVVQQVLVVFGYVLVGWMACKIGVLGNKVNDSLTNIIVKITLPFSIIAAADVDTSGSDLANMGWTALVLLISYMISAALVACYARVKKLTPEQHAIYNGLCVFPNSGFIGIPLCVALMGDRGMLYGAAGMVAYNAFFFTYQYLLFRPNEKIRLKLFLTPLNLCVVALGLMLALGVRLPTTIQTVTYNVGAMTTPLALMIIGAMLAEGDLMSLLRSKKSYLFTLLRNIVFPLALLCVLAVLPFDYEMKLATIMYAACPCANLTVVFAAQAKMETELCAKTILLSTLFFLVTLPFILWVAQIVFA
ncbi:MAG: AEC family transporter [Faecalibacterium sp.]